MTIIDDATVVAYTPAELSTALTTDNGFNYIYLGADISMTSGIRIDPAKTFVTIDGLYLPESPDARTLTDTGASGGQIYMNSVNAQGADIIFQNIIIHGRNYYGMPFIYDTTNAEYVTVTYQNVIYTGPQITWHPRGLARYIDCDVTIMSNGYSPMNEVAEINRVEVGGTTIIRHNNTGYAVFYFYRANPYFTVLENSVVEISTMYDFLYHSGSYYVPFHIQQGASFTLSTARGISRSSSHRAASVRVDENAAFRYIRESSAGDAHALYLNGALTVRENATVYMQADFANSGALIRFTSSSAGIDIDNPKSFAVYNSGTTANAAAFSFQYQIPVKLAGGQVNFWRTAEPFPDAGGLDDIPLHKWNRPDWSLFELRGTTDSSATAITYNDFTPEELEDLPPLTDLRLYEARVLSIGRIPLEVNPVIWGLDPVTGMTEGGARVRISYIDGGPDPEDDADSTGYFSLEPVEPIPFADLVTVFTNTPFLIVSATVMAEDDGELSIDSSPDLIEFELRPFTIGSAALLPRKNYDVPVVVRDTRSPEKTQWKLWASIDGPLTAEDGESLENALVFAEPDDNLITLGTDPLAVYTDGPYPDEDTTEVTWSINKGLLAHITVPLRSKKRYTAQLHWSVYPTGIEPEDNQP